MITALRKDILITLLAILGLFIVPQQIEATNLYTHTKIDQLTGLSNDKVTSIAKDLYGIYWIGTQRGLNRIVNGHIDNFDDLPQFANQRIKLVYRDAQSRMWIATDNNLYLYDYESQTFKLINTTSNYSAVNSIGSVNQGVIICRRDAIEIYDGESSKLLNIANSENLEFNALSVIDGNSAVVTCSLGRDIYKLNIEELTLDPYEDINLPQRNTKYRDIIHVDNRGYLWVSVYNHYLARYSLKGEGELVKKYSVGDGNLSNSVILDITEHKGELLIATDGGGINSIDIDSGTSKPSSRIFDYRDLPLSNAVNNIFVDPVDGLFLGTIRDGLICIHNTYIQSHTLNSFGSDSDIKYNLNIAALCFCEWKESVLVGTDGKGLYVYSSNSQEFKLIPSTKNLKVTDISIINYNSALISVYNKGLFRLNLQSGALESVNISNKETNQIIADKNLVITLSKRNGANIVVFADKIYIYNIHKNIITEPSNNNISDLYNLYKSGEDATQIYVNNLYNFYAIDKKSYEVKLIYHDITGSIISARKLGDTIWINRNYSLYKYDISTQTETPAAPDFNNKVLSLELDHRNNIWFTTHDNLVVINPSKPDQYIYFDESMGYTPSEYLPRSSMLASSGEIYFGGNRGMIFIDRLIPLNVDPANNIELLSIKVGDEIISVEKYKKTQKITIPWNYSSIELETYVSNRNIYHNNLFRYVISSENKKSTITSNNQISLQTLAPGEYSIEASYLNNNGEWCSLTKIIDIVIITPWWNSLLFRSIIIITILMLLLLLATIYIRSRGRKLLQLHYEREQELSNNKIKFLINISHELRTPLTLIYAPLKRLLESESIVGESHRTLVNIFGQSRYMTELINMVLDSRRIEAGYGVIEITPHNFNEWITTITNEFQDECEQRGIKLQLNLDPTIGTLNFDGTKCRTVLSNLLMNAIRYSRSDGNGEIIIRSEKYHRSIRLSVIDNGIGLVGIDIDNLFNRFVRVNNQSAGSGIGLSYSKSIIEQHKGASIGAYCNSVQGATFYFELPTDLECENINIEAKPQLDSDFETNVSASIVKHLNYSLSKHTILIVEDQPELLTFISNELKPMFKNVYTASNGEEAFKIAKQVVPSIIVSDIMMPKMDGYELSYNIKNDIEVSHIPIILLTAKTDAGSKVMGYKSGADVYISKPFDITYLVSVISSQLYSRDISRRRYSQVTSEIQAAEITYSNADEQFMIKLNSFIIDNLGSNIDVELISKHMCMSRAALYKKLKTIIDIGAMEYVTKIRMTTAAERLLTTSSSITEIAMQCGYTDNQYFSKAFKQFHTISPSQYRKSQQDVNGEKS